MCIVIICCLAWDIIGFEINQDFFMKLSFFITQKSGETCKYLKNEKGF